MNGLDMPRFRPGAIGSRYRSLMALGRGKTEHGGPRDMSRKSGHWGFTEEAKAWASRARRRDEKRALAEETVPDSVGPEDPDLSK